MTARTPTRHSHPFVFLILIVPFGMMSGYLTVALAYLLSRAGLSVAEVGTLVAVSFVPHTWKFLWAPIIDTTLRRRTWYITGAVLSAAGIFASGVVPATPKALPLLTAVVLASNVAVTFLAMAVESLMAYSTPDAQKGRAGGWFQAGNLGGGGIGGGAGLWMAQVLPEPWMAAAVLAAVCLACCAGLWFVAEPPLVARAHRYRHDLAAVGKDLWTVARSRGGYLALLICFLPIGSGSAAGLWSAVADDWRASAATVALATGVFSGIVSAIGCIAGGFLCDRIDRKTAYGLYGLLLAAVAVGMAIAPRTEAMYIVFTTAYSFVSGLCYAAFSAVVLEAIGLGAAATKYSLFSSLSNMPIAYMTIVDASAHTQGGASGMLYADAAAGVLGLLLFMAVARASRPRVPASACPIPAATPASRR
jgi:MFS family permease